jgi:hypothetical protein
LRAEPAATTTLRATVTHLIAGEAIGRAGDAIAIVRAGDAPGGEALRLFVPGWLPCGECPICRRGLCAACPNGRISVPRASALVDQPIELPERFLTALEATEDRPADQLIAAGLVAEIIGVASRAGLGPGETAIWLGRSPWTRIGASWSARRGCRTFLLSPTQAEAAPPPPEVTPLEPSSGPAVWRALVESAEAAGGPAGPRPERRIFIFGDGAALAGAALELAVVGSTLSFPLGAPAVITGLDAAPPLRLFSGSALHPDLVPEALAAIRRGDVDVADTFREVAPAGRDDAVAAFRSGLDPRLPVIVL